MKESESFLARDMRPSMSIFSHFSRSSGSLLIMLPFMEKLVLGSLMVSL